MAQSTSNTQEQNILNNQRGQSFVEFLLLLLVIVGVSMGFMKILNTNIAEYWEVMANILLSDMGTSESVKIR